MEEITEFALRLPARKPSVDRLSRQESESLDKFLRQLLDAVWDLDEAGELPPRISRLIRGWIAHIRFDENPSNQEYRDQVRQRMSAG